MDEKTFLNQIEKILELKQNTLKGNESLESLEWDSLTVLHFIAFSDKTFSEVLVN